MARVELTAEALAEANRATGWYRQHAGDDVAGRLVDSIASALVQIGEGPERWPRIAHGARKLLLPDFPYAIVYRVFDDVAIVVAVAHAKRRPEYWKRRGSKPRKASP